MSCSDRHCPVHARFPTRGRILTGTVLRTSPLTAKVEIPRLHYLPKYERYTRRRTRLAVHVPQCMAVKPGDRVLIQECRPISKTKRFVVLCHESSSS